MPISHLFCNFCTKQQKLLHNPMKTSPESNVTIEVIFYDETFWLTQKRMAELFGVEVNTINYHLKEIFKSFELQEDSVIRKIRITAEGGKITSPIFNTSMRSLQ